MTATIQVVRVEDCSRCGGEGWYGDPRRSCGLCHQTGWEWQGGIVELAEQEADGSFHRENPDGKVERAAMLRWVGTWRAGEWEVIDE